MGLGSSERSGTPLETRGAAEAAGIDIEGLFTPGGGFGGATQRIASPLQRLGTQAQQNLLAQQFGNQNLQQILGGALADPASRTEGLFAALEPFEARETERQTAGLRSSFGQQGGRFSENLLGAETELRGELGNQFRRSREQGLLQAGQLQAQNIGTALQALLGAQEQGAQTGLQGLQQVLGFAQPGPPVIEQGLLPGLLQAGANIGGMAMMPGGGGGGGGANPMGIAPPPPRIPNPTLR